MSTNLHSNEGRKILGRVSCKARLQVPNKIEKIVNAMYKVSSKKEAHSRQKNTMGVPSLGKLATRGDSIMAHNLSNNIRIVKRKISRFFILI